MDVARTNWAGNVVFRASGFHRPGSLPELQSLVAGSDRVRALGSGHSFNRIADTTGDLVTVAGLPQVIEIDSDRAQVRVSAGTRYGELGQALQRAGFALANTGSLPHISVAGASSTGTHGSGVGNRNLAAIVSAVELVTATGEQVSGSREADGDQFNGMVLALGSLGIMTSLTLDVVPTFEVQQHVFDGLVDAEIDDHLAEILAGGYSVSVFSDWKSPRQHQIWRKRRADPGVDPSADPTWFSAALADSPRNPVAGMPPAHATAQLGEFGPWNERLPHFRLDFTPSSGEELQTEYLLPRQHAVAAFRALDDIADQVAAVLQVSELRTVAADDLWISPNYHTDTIAFHFTWIPDEAAVSPVLTAIEERLAPFRARPHWGKVFNTAPDVLEGLYERLPDFRRLVADFDPSGKFRNDLIDHLLPVHA